MPSNVDVRSTACYIGQYSLSPGRWYQATGQTDDMWILDVDGQRQVFAFATTPETPADLLHEVDAIRDSIVIEPI